MEILLGIAFTFLVYVAIRSFDKKRVKREFEEECDVIYRHIKKESDKEAVRNIKELAENEGDVSSQEGREKVIEYLEFALIAEVARSITEKHSEVIKRKKRQFLYIDEYGIEREDKWFSERKYFVEKVLLPQVNERLQRYDAYKFRTEALNLHAAHVPSSVEFWESFVDRHIDAAKEVDEEYKKIYECDVDESPVVPNFDFTMTGAEYERFVADDVVEKSNWQCLVTPATGDHGADIIASYRGLRVAIQCKFYRSPVGNKSVQEVYSAKDYYECGFAIVVSNAEYTTAARQAASSLGVSLLHHEELPSFLDELEGELIAPEPGATG